MGRTYRTPMAIMGPGSWLLPACLICWRRCMLTKRREDAKHDSVEDNGLFCRDAGTAAQPLPGAGDFCRGDFRCLRVFGTAPAQGAPQVHPLDAVSFPLDRRGHRLGYVSLLALTRGASRSFALRGLHGASDRPEKLALRYAGSSSSVVRASTSKRPVIFAFGFLDGQILDAGKACAHQTVFIEFPVRIAVGTKGGRR